MKSLEDKMTIRKNIRNYIVLAIMLSMVFLSNGQDKRFAAYTLVDPVATYKDGFNIGFGIEYQMTDLYFKAEVFSFPDLRGASYLHLQGTVFGINHHNWNDEWRVFGGAKLGIIKREKYGYPSFGFESGVDWYPSRYEDGFYIGIVLSLDYRTDFQYWGSDPDWVNNGGFKAGFTW